MASPPLYVINAFVRSLRNHPTGTIQTGIVAHSLAGIESAEVVADSYTPNHAQRPAWKDLRDKFESVDVECSTRDFVDATLDLFQARRTTVETNAPAIHSAATLLPAVDQFEELLTRPSLGAEDPAFPDRRIRQRQVLAGRRHVGLPSHCSDQRRRIISSN